MKKPRQKYLVIFNNLVKVVWYPTLYTVHSANVMLDLDNQIMRKNRYGDLSDTEYKRYYRQYENIIRDFCTSNMIKDKLPWEK